MWLLLVGNVKELLDQKLKFLGEIPRTIHRMFSYRWFIVYMVYEFKEKATPTKCSLHDTIMSGTLL